MSNIMSLMFIAYYGYEHVMKAVELGAIDTLMLSDNLFRYAIVQSET